MFLKFLDDMDEIREEKTVLVGKRFKPAIDSSYHWRDWANKTICVSKPELIAFINLDEAVNPDGKRGSAPFA